MAEVNWKEVLGWRDDQLSEIRFSGFSFLREGHYRTAITFFEALSVLNPTSAYDIQTLGALYLQVGENEKALEKFNRALQLAPTHEPTLLNKVKTLLALNQRSEALAIARMLEKSTNPAISSDASALLATYR